MSSDDESSESENEIAENVVPVLFFLDRNFYDQLCAFTPSKGASTEEREQLFTRMFFAYELVERAYREGSPLGVMRDGVFYEAETAPLCTWPLSVDFEMVEESIPVEVESRGVFLKVYDGGKK